jgi:hypothetical protein
MKKNEVIEKDGQKCINKEEVLLDLEYSLLGKLSILLFRLIAFCLGIGMILIDNLFAQIFGVLCLVYGWIGFFLSLFFTKIVFYKKSIETNWNFLGWTFNKHILYSEATAMKINGIFGGSISFLDKKNRLDSMLFFTIDLFPIQKEEILKIKNILIEKKIIKGDENVWSN